ncbi:MAG TPA: MFS transporter [Blastocatellia bacterium]|nr:MFS transporter [Blastocatellia bacterium]
MSHLTARLLTGSCGGVEYASLTKRSPENAFESARRPEPVVASSKGDTRAFLFVSLAVFLASSPWFSGTAAVSVLRREWSLSDSASALLTTSVQLGFITGTFLYAYLNLADRFNARRVFVWSALLSALFNVGFAFLSGGLVAASTFRFLTGVMLAGIYPVGMKLVASWFKSGLGWRLGVFVGALTLGTASPFLIQAVGASVNWKLMVVIASLTSVAGGLLVGSAVGDGPYLRKRAVFDGRMLLKVFSHKPFRYTAFGYFGHMWELYAFWSLGVFYLRAHLESVSADSMKLVSVVAFVTIAMGAAGCIAGGWVSRTVGERKVALVSLIISGVMCALSGYAFLMPSGLLVVYLFVWGFFVVADSPQFSALAASYCPPEYTGTALTVQNGIGFGITVVSIQLLPILANAFTWRWAFVFLAAGPAVGAFFMSRLGTANSIQSRNYAAPVGGEAVP